MGSVGKATDPRSSLSHVNTAAKRFIVYSLNDCEPFCTADFTLHSFHSMLYSWVKNKKGVGINGGLGNPPEK